MPMGGAGGATAPGANNFTAPTDASSESTVTTINSLRINRKMYKIPLLIFMIKGNRQFPNYTYKLLFLHS